jgi:NTE family protein
LEELRRTEVVVDGQTRRLIDEVDVITGVSGGSFTALAYALHRERLFSEYEEYDAFVREFGESAED